ncbi:hypothetical protein E3Q22_04199 [Wallemia mellicola]|uniref:Uncharacterized protein n=1 Tax=Wallemia mellicola TaxID=1708541 RepID=A0A4T0PE31_9BASI|nr:hypothetical protein E3Q24_04111 [Wallemia mellicola]TIB70403.1 hypothetical protein E3Q23_04196 [Wallemia mellicola]TIB74344.1 hypothetical protein E3Q22_04199 [Wallemia mellicola]TIB79352.1 hypothetical protein E3Q21_04144 [Wallemia mellicola]TIB83489.1 hypothetical protein E3Q20_04125 [Wallemia mellicola]
MRQVIQKCHEETDKLVKRIEELKKHDNVDILPRKDLENEESSLTIVETLCIRISVMDLVTLTLSYLYFFVIVSYRILDFNILIGRYFKFLEDSICKLY